MSHYSNDLASCRVSFFRCDENGRPYKWYADEAVKFLIWKGSPAEGGKLLHDAFLQALRRHLTWEGEHLRYRGMMAICLDPYHENSCPICVIVP